MSYQYSQEAKERIFTLGHSTVIEFIEEIPQAKRRVIYNRLPKVDGFRQGTLTQAEIKERQKRLIGHMFRTYTDLDDGAAWKTFSLIWISWAEAHIGKDFPKGYGSVDVCSGSNFFMELASRFPKTSREDIERLFTFSCFSDDPNITAAFTSFHPAIDLIRDKMVDEFPIRLGGLEGRLEIIEAEVNKSESLIKRLELVSRSLDDEIKKNGSDIRHNIGVVSELQTSRGVDKKRFDMLEKAVDELAVVRKNNVTALAEINSKMGFFISELELFSFRGDTWDKVVVEVNELNSSMTAITSSEADWIRSVEVIGTLAERITILEGLLAENRPDSETNQRIKLVENNPEGPFADILSIESACGVIASNLQAIGVVKGTSITAARQMVAAFIAGLMVQFSGSLADIVADAVASAVGGPTYHEWPVPVGLISGEAASDCIKKVAKSSGCLLLKGANLSAFEVYGTAIRDVIVRRQFSASGFDHIALIAAWAQGPATFPDGGMLAELGPVFDTDNLKMRGISAQLPLLKFGCLSKVTWKQLEGLEIDSLKPVIVELRELLNEAGFEGGNLWKRSLNRIYDILTKMPGGNPVDDLHLLFMSWVIPWAKVSGGPVREINLIAEREFTERRDETTV